ncbi:MAG: hypothetical protein KF711_05280 [Nitrospira sp.]|nr:hypothetical protein [Nitrospira sp.]
MLRCSQPHVSHHLRILRDRLGGGHRHGKQVCYRVDPTVQRAEEPRRTGARLWMLRCDSRPQPCSPCSISRETRTPAMQAINILHSTWNNSPWH